MYTRTSRLGRVLRNTAIAALVAVGASYVGPVHSHEVIAQKAKEPPGANDSKPEERIGEDELPIPTVKPAGLLKHLQRAAICDDFVMAGDAKGQPPIEREMTLAYMQEHVRQRLSAQRQSGRIDHNAESDTVHARNDNVVELLAMLSWGVSTDSPRIELLTRYVDQGTNEASSALKGDIRAVSLSDETCYLSRYLSVLELHYMDLQAQLADSGVAKPTKRLLAKRLDAVQSQIKSQMKLLTDVIPLMPFSKSRFYPGHGYIDVSRGILAAQRAGVSLDPAAIDWVEAGFRHFMQARQKFGLDAIVGDGIALEINRIKPAPTKKSAKRSTNPVSEGSVREVEVITALPKAWYHRDHWDGSNPDGMIGVRESSTAGVMVSMLRYREILRRAGRDPFKHVSEKEFVDAMWSGFAFISRWIESLPQADEEATKDVRNLSHLWASVSELCAATGNDFVGSAEWYPIAVRNALRHWHSAAQRELDQIEAPFRAAGKSRTDPDRVAAVRAFLKSDLYKSRVVDGAPAGGARTALLMLQGESAPREKSLTGKKRSQNPSPQPNPGAPSDTPAPAGAAPKPDDPKPAGGPEKPAVPAPPKKDGENAKGHSA